MGDPRDSGLELDLYSDYADLGRANVFKRVRRERRDPESGAGRKRRRVSAVERDGAVLVATDKVADAEHIECGGPAVGMQGSALAGLDDSVEDANAVVLEEKLVVCWSGGEGIEFGRPGFVRQRLLQEL